MVDNADKKKTFNAFAVKILICFLLLLQLFPPLWVQDVTSLRHFLIALFDVSALAVVCTGVFKYRTNIASVFKFKPFVIWAALIVWMAISMIWAINIIESIAVLNRWILIFGASTLTGILLCDNKKIFHVLVFCTIAVTLINVLTCIIGYYYFDLHISQRRNLMLNGGYGNKNIFAVCLLLKLPLLYYAALRYKNVWKIICWLLIASVSFCLIILSTRSTFIGLFMQIIFLIAYATLQKFRFRAQNRYLLYTLVVILCTVAGFFAGNWFIQYNYNKYAKKDVQNNYTVAARVKTIEEGNSKGRLIIWHNTAEIIKKHPLRGYGVGNHKLAIMQVEAAKKMNYVVSDHAHNDFLEMQSELGITGELLYILLYLSTALIGIRTIYSKKTKEPYRLIALCSLLLLVTYMNDALFNFPNERASCQVYLALSIGLMMFAYFKSNANNYQTDKAKYVLIFFCILTAACLYTESSHFVSSVIQRQRIMCHNSHNRHHIPPSHWEHVTPWLPNIDESTKPIKINNAMMYALEGDYRTAVDMVLSDNANPYYGLKEYRLASYYAHLNMTDSSNIWADRCIAMKPLCYDPVSVKIGNCKKAGDISGQIKLLEDYLQRQQNEPRAWICLIDIYLGQGDYNQAEKIYQQFLVNNDEIPEILAKKSEINKLKAAEIKEKTEFKQK